MRAIYKQKKIYIFLIIVLLLIILRIILPSILLKEANKFLGSFSPTYSLHMEDLDISILRGAYTFEKIEGKLKNKEQTVFLTINKIDVSMAWRVLLKGKIVTDIEADRIYFLFLKDMTQLSPPKKEANDVKDTLFPVKVETLAITNSRMVFEEYPSLSDKNRLRLEDINGKVYNLTPSDDNPVSDLNLSASLQGSSAVKVEGAINLRKDPTAWSVDVLLKDFDLTKLNPVLKRNLPLTFTKGKLDLYIESKTSGKNVIGYIKPFLKDIDVVANKEKFVGIKHFFIEVLTALGNLILRDNKNKTVATYVDFTYDGKNFNVDKGQGIENAIAHGFKDKIKPGLEKKYHLDK